MKKLLFVLIFAFGCALHLPAQGSNVPLGTVRTVDSNHSTTPDGIQSWGSHSLLSPSGRWYSEDSHFGLDCPDGYSSLDVVLDEPGVWQVWQSYGFAAPQASSTWQQPENYLQVGPPPNQAPTISWSLTPANVASGQSYTVSAHGHDDDGNLTQVNLWKNGQPFAFAGGGNGTDSDSSNGTADAGPQTVTFTAQSVDSAGAVSVIISHTVTIDPPPPAVQYSLAALAGPGGSVSPGGVFDAGYTAVLVATPDSTHDFTGWTGNAAGATNPLGLVMDGNKTVWANFSVKSFALTTSATSGGSTTPGGTYPYGTTVTIAATPDVFYYFTGWTGDATGPASSVAVLLDRAKFAQASFAPKAAQTISFSPPGNQNVGAALPLTATSSSGLPVNFIVSGPASFSSGTLVVTGPGAITIQAVQPGDAYTLAAPPVTGTFNAAAPAMLHYQAAARTLLQTDRMADATNYVLGNP